MEFSGAISSDERIELAWHIAGIGAGSPFGEAALLNGEKRNASIRALSYCDVYRLDKSDFDALRSKYAEFNVKVEEVVGKRANKE